MTARVSIDLDPDELTDLHLHAQISAIDGKIRSSVGPVGGWSVSGEPKHLRFFASRLVEAAVKGETLAQLHPAERAS